MFYYSILVLFVAVGLYKVYWALDTLPLQYYKLLVEAYTYHLQHVIYDQISKVVTVWSLHAAYT